MTNKYYISLNMSKSAKIVLKKVIKAEAGAMWENYKLPTSEKNTESQELVKTREGQD